MFESGKALVPMGCIKFSPECPKNDILVLDDGTNRKLAKAEIASLVQMDLMKEEVVAMVRTKTNNGNITFQLPVEKRNKMHDDRAYAFFMAAWWLYQIRTDETLGESVSIDYSIFFGNTSHNHDQSNNL